MQGALILTIIFGGTIAALVIIGSTLILMIKMLKGGVSHDDRNRRAEEARMIQEIYRELSKMEERVDSLETILLDKKAKESSHAAH